jgi:hypothetical protein
MNQELITSILILLLGIVFSIYIYRYLSGQKDSYRNLAQSRLDDCIELLGVPVDNVKFYTDGHLYVWVESSLEEVRSYLAASCVGSPYGQPRESGVLIKSNAEKYRIYLVAENRHHMMDKLMHYQEWIDSNKEVSDQIARHKNV